MAAFQNRGASVLKPRCRGFGQHAAVLQQPVANAFPILTETSDMAARQLMCHVSLPSEGDSYRCKPYMPRLLHHQQPRLHTFAHRLNEPHKPRSTMIRTAPLVIRAQLARPWTHARVARPSQATRLFGKRVSGRGQEGRLDIAGTHCRARPAYLEQLSARFLAFWLGLIFSAAAVGALKHSCTAEPVAFWKALSEGLHCNH
jgi:hypothetical protein